MKLLKYLFLLLTFYSYSQYCPSLGPNQILPCGVNSTTLTADLSQCGPGGPNGSTARLIYSNDGNTWSASTNGNTLNNHGR